MDTIAWLVIIGVPTLLVLYVVLLVVLVKRQGRKRAAAIAARRAEEEAYLSTLTDTQRLEYRAQRAADQQAEATRRAGLGIAAVIGFGGFDHE